MRKSTFLSFSIFFFLLLNLFLSTTSFSQIKLNVNASFRNLLRYGNGYEYSGPLKISKEYFEDLGDARININNIIVGLRYEISDPIEYGRNFKGIRKRYIEYAGDKSVYARAGDFWDIISRGMTLNVFEDRSLGYDTGIDGVRVGYKNSFLWSHDKETFSYKAQIIGGNLEYSDYLNPERIESYKIRNGNLEISPWKFLTLGGNYVYAKGEIPSAGVVTNIRAELPEMYVNLTSKYIQFYSSYAHKSIITDPSALYPVSMTAKGDGLYSSVSFTKSSFGATIDYKNYRFDLTAPDNRSTERPTKFLPFQNPPTAQREHSSVLISRNPHVVNFNDEVGFQADINYSYSDKLNFLFNASMASEHYQYTDIDPTGRIVYQRVERSSSFMPSLEDAFNPFWEYYAEGEYYASDKVYAKLAFHRQNSIVYNQINPLSSEKLFTSTVPVEIRYSLNDVYTLKFIFEQQWEHNSLKINKKDFMNQYAAINLQRSPNLGLTVSAEFTNDKEEPTGKSTWYQGEIFYKLAQSHTVTLSYGSERGGLKCTNGICRFVNPFEGFRFTIQTLF